jgi:thioredoxin-related protein
MSLANANPDGLPDILPVPASLQAAARLAHAKGEPLVVMVTLKGCTFCDVVRNHYLGPMHHRGEVFAVQVNMLDRKSVLQDVRGHSTTPYDQARAWKARIAPTLLFLDHQGNEVAERLEGMGLADFYGPYLQARLDASRRKIRAG